MLQTELSRWVDLDLPGFWGATERLLDGPDEAYAHATYYCAQMSRKGQEAVHALHDPAIPAEIIRLEEL